ncbi:MAG TPA: ABC transporter ATP-binding protein [Conexibacter sp.]|nr:ABC transporter ATP-binding protein [Conexibacter sp.]
MLELREVVKHYRTGDAIVPAVDGVSLAIEPGEVVALYGPSGSGKTTLLLLAAGMTTPDAGQVLFNGRSVGELNARDGTRFRRSELGFVLQQFHLIPCMPAIDNAALKLVAEGMSRKAARKQAAAWLERVGLAERRNHPPERLSTGERQRVAIARALANKPGVILADEPTGSLDTSRAQEILAMLADISHGEGVGVLLVTHDPEAAAFADRVRTLRDGKLTDAAPHVADVHAVRALGDAG